LEELAARGRPIHFDEGQTIFIEGEISGRVVIIRSGTARVTFSGAAGRRPIAIVGPGSLLGEFSALDGEPHGSTVTAIDAVEATTFGSVELIDFLRESHDGALWLLRNILRRLRQAERRRVEFAPISNPGGMSSPR
jgi:CRP-like cAMP-binding protein